MHVALGPAVHTHISLRSLLQSTIFFTSQLKKKTAVIYMYAYTSDAFLCKIGQECGEKSVYLNKKNAPKL